MIQHRHAAVFVSTLYNDVKRSIGEKNNMATMSATSFSRSHIGQFMSCKEAERRITFIENRKRRRVENDLDSKK